MHPQLEPKTNRPADYEGKITIGQVFYPWRVWICPIPEKVGADATIACWLVDAPGYHLAWRCWRLSLVHLRPIEGVPPAVLKHPTMTHELISQAIDPDSAPDPEDPREHRVMRPLDFVIQFTAPDDRTAVQGVEELVRAIPTGRLHPDADFNQQWKHLLEHALRILVSKATS